MRKYKKPPVMRVHHKGRVVTGSHHEDKSIIAQNNLACKGVC